MNAAFQPVCGFRIAAIFQPTIPLNSVLAEVCGVDAEADVSDGIVFSLQAMSCDMAI